MNTHEDLSGCHDCPADVTSTAGTSPVSGGPVLVVTVAHEPSCPTWLHKLANNPERQTMAPTPDRLLRHVVKDADG